MYEVRQGIMQIRFCGKHLINKNMKDISKNIVPYLLGLAGLFVTVYVAGKAWHASDK